MGMLYVSYFSWTMHQCQVIQFSDCNFCHDSRYQEIIIFHLFLKNMHLVFVQRANFYLSLESGYQILQSSKTR